MPGAGRNSGTEKRNSGNTYPYRGGFAPSELKEEKDAEGWIDTTTPEGVPDGERNAIITAGSRGSAVPKPPTVPRTTKRRGNE